MTPEEGDDAALVENTGSPAICPLFAEDIVYPPPPFFLCTPGSMPSSVLLLDFAVREGGGEGR